MNKTYIGAIQIGTRTFFTFRDKLYCVYGDFIFYCEAVSVSTLICLRFAEYSVNGYKPTLLEEEFVISITSTLT